MAKKDESGDVQGLSIADLVTALRALKGEDDETLKKRAQYEAEAHRRLDETENKTHPGISAYSYPEGDVARPKAPLKCEMFWVGYPLDLSNLTPLEAELLNRADIGEFTFERTNGSVEKLTVTGETDAKGRLRKLLFNFPCRGDNSRDLPSMSTMLRQAFGLPTAEQEELARLRAEVATLTAVVAGA